MHEEEDDIARRLAAKWEQQLGSGLHHHRSFLMNMNPGRGRHGSYGSRASAASNTDVSDVDEVLASASSLMGTPKLSIRLKKTLLNLPVALIANVRFPCQAN